MLIPPRSRPKAQNALFGFRVNRRLHELMRVNRAGMMFQGRGAVMPRRSFATGRWMAYGHVASQYPASFPPAVSVNPFAVESLSPSQPLFTVKESGMPLSQPAERERLHTRAIEINGYRRTDGHYDIEAHLTDCKSFGQTNYDRGYIEPGEPIHDMWMRLTVDEKMNIHAVEAVSDKTPYVMCPTAAPNFKRLVGMQIKAGFLREATHQVGGT
ncbi:MAG TPA: DUF2889 domain-containing protein, partial [Rhodopila sp.]